MAIIFPILLVLMLISSSAAHGAPDVVGTSKKILFPDWLEQGTLKWGFVGSLCLYQSLSGAVDGYHFRQEDPRIVNGGNYHAFVTAQRASGIMTGWFGYANFRNTERSWVQKGRLAIGAGLWARNAMEWTYKGQRYGNPFDYSEKHNEHAIVYFGFRGGKLTDLYIGTGKYSGPAVDCGFMVLGWLLLRGI